MLIVVQADPYQSQDICTGCCFSWAGGGGLEAIANLAEAAAQKREVPRPPEADTRSNLKDLGSPSYDIVYYYSLLKYKYILSPYIILWYTVLC